MRDAEKDLEYIERWECTLPPRAHSIFSYWITRAQQLEERIGDLEQVLRDVYDWLKKNKMEHTAHGKYIAEVLSKPKQE